MSTFNTDAERFSRNYGRSKEDGEAANKTRLAIRETYNRLVEEESERIFFNLPYSDFRKATQAFTCGKRGHLGERYINRVFHHTQTNKPGKGDLTNGRGENIEVKTSGIHANGHIVFAGIRPDDAVSTYVFATLHDDYFVTHEVSAEDLSKLRLTPERNKRGQFIAQFYLGGTSYENLLEVSKVRTWTDEDTNLRPKPHAFLDKAGLVKDDLKHMADFKEDVNKAAQGRNTLSHMGLDELLEIYPFVESGKFGHILQDWVLDHLEVATNTVPGQADGVGKNGTIEVKTSGLSGSNQFKLTGIRPAEFNELILALNFGDTVEFFKLNRREAARFCSPKVGFGSETNDGTFSVTFSASERNKALNFLRRTKAFDMRVDLH